jgi:hypothetical protein
MSKIDSFLSHSMSQQLKDAWAEPRGHTQEASRIISGTRKYQNGKIKAHYVQSMSMLLSHA